VVHGGVQQVYAQSGRRLLVHQGQQFCRCRLRSQQYTTGNSLPVHGGTYGLGGCGSEVRRCTEGYAKRDGSTNGVRQVYDPRRDSSRTVYGGLGRQESQTVYGWCTAGVANSVRTVYGGVYSRVCTEGVRPVYIGRVYSSRRDTVERYR